MIVILIVIIVTESESLIELVGAVGGTLTLIVDS